jgi:hypothetical protein
MPLLRRASKKWKNFNMPVSYKVNAEERLIDASNVVTIQDVLETRHGISRWNETAFSASPQSISYFKDNSNDRYMIVKDGTTLYRARQTGAHVSLDATLSATTKHRGVTFNNRHIMAIESDGLYSYDGVKFSPLGQAGPNASPTVSASGTGNTLTASDYQVAYTFYSSQLGFESNLGATSSTVTVASGEQIDVSGMTATATNTFIDKIRIYYKDITNDSAWLFWAELDISEVADTIDDDPTSTQVAPTTNGAPTTGGGKYLAVYGQELAYAGNSTYPSDIFFSEAFLPDAFDSTETASTINIAGNGPITGIGVGYFSGDNQNPYLVAFKRNHIELFTEASGNPQQVIISTDLGCVSHDTIRVINGDVFFMSTKGWHAIKEGRLVKTRGAQDSIDNGDIEDIFKQNGQTFELNKADFSNFFSVYYPTLQQYMTFISEGNSTDIQKSYNFEFEIGGFRPYDFDVKFSGACLGEDGLGEDIVYLCGEGGYVYSHSIKETKGTDIDNAGSEVAIDAFAKLYWINGDDMDASYNFGPFILRAITQENDITVRYFLNYSQRSSTDIAYSFNDPDGGFILDVSKLDEGILTDGRTIVRHVGEILRSGQSLLIGLYKSQKGESMALLEGQLDVQKNGNPN